MNMEPMDSINVSNTTSNISENNAECTLFEDATKCEIVTNLKRASVALSTIGSVFTIGLIVLYKKYREPSQRIIAHLAVASLIYGLVYVIEDRIVTEATWQCKFQGAMMTYTTWVCFLWIICMLFNLYFQLLFALDYRRYQIPIAVTCWILPVVIAALPFIDDMYAPAGAWCWMKNNSAWRYGLLYVWRILFVLVFIIVMGHIFWKLRLLQQSRHSSVYAMNRFEKDVKSLRIYPIAYFVLNLFPIINRVQNLIAGDGGNKNHSFVLWIFQAVTDPILDLTIAVIYTFDTRTRKRLNRRDIAIALRKWSQKTSTIKEFSGNMSSEVPTASEQATDSGVGI